jgi:hypothetical protein
LPTGAARRENALEDIVAGTDVGAGADERPAVDSARRGVNVRRRNEVLSRSMGFAWNNHRTEKTPKRG